MKIWKGYGSAHSANLVIIGTFKSVDDAVAAERLIEAVTAAAVRDHEPADGASYSGPVRAVLVDNNLNLPPKDIEDFIYDFDRRRADNQLVITTEEQTFQGFLNVMLARGARVEVYSAHDYPTSGHGR